MRFKEIVSIETIVDTETGIEYKGIVDTELIDLMNAQDFKIKFLLKNFAEVLIFMNKLGYDIQFEDSNGNIVKLNED